ncbi:MAG TPA: glucose-6-phosphate isomerase [Chitinivibrionales bacterium]|jgi:glucose-6-phosphate isomerase|nr:glucose-6-phosphate isomerase [Chitinivibrionales bacterium]
MQKISYDDKCLGDWIKDNEWAAYSDSFAAAQTMLEKRSGPGNNFLGWLDLPATIDAAVVKKVRDTADALRPKTEVLICIGIGGSYLGARAAIEFVSPSFEDLRKPRVIFAGHQINSDYITDLLELVKDKNVAVNVISKSGTTTEPGIAFRIIKQWMEKRYGKKEAAERIVATTDPAKGALHRLAIEEKYATFDIPSDVGGRFSVLTPVGLFPCAMAGLDVAKLLAGAKEAMAFCSAPTLDKNIAGRYAAARNILFRRGRTTEVMALFAPQLHFLGDWFKQLAGESEGKNLTGIFPASVDYTTDLHSLGQWMQEGLRNVFETFVVLGRTNASVALPRLDDDSDELNYLAGKNFEDVNAEAYRGTLLAHLDGNVPCATITLADRTEETLGQAFYFFEKAIALSGYLLRVNPFDQPGVEAYKKNMFALLSKPGNEKKGSELKQRLSKLGL